MMIRILDEAWPWVTGAVIVVSLVAWVVLTTKIEVRSGIEFGRFPLVHDAIIKGQSAERIQAIVEANPDLVNVRGPIGLMPIHIAASVGRPEAIRVLIDAGSEIDVYSQMPGDEGGRTPLHFAVSKNHVESARVLLDAGANPYLVNLHGDNAFEIARSKAMSDLLERWRHKKAER